jgi:hypothetical protein
MQPGVKIMDDKQTIPQVTEQEMRQYLLRRWPSNRLAELRQAGVYEDVLASTASNMAQVANQLMAEGFNQVEAEHQAYEAFGKI